MKYKNLICYFLLPLFICPASGAGNLTFDSYTHIVELEEKNSRHEINAAINVSGALQEFDLNLPPGIENLKVYVDEKEASYHLEEKIGFSVLRSSLPEKNIGRHFISITYDTDYPVIELQDRILYKSEYIPTAKTARFDYILKLQVGYIIPEEKNVSFFINPKPRTIYSDGQRIILLWELKDVTAPFEVSVLMEPVDLSLSGIRGIVRIMVLMIFFGSGLIYYLKKVRRETMTYPALVEHEKAVVDLLTKAEDNVLWQKQIQVRSGFSKVKLSRILKSLEKRGVIRKEQWGNTNKIHLLQDEKTPETSEKET